MKCLVLISNYGTSQLDFCKNLIDGLLQINKYYFDIKVFSSENLLFEECENFTITNYSGHNFPLSIYDYLKSIDLSFYSHVLLTENDLFFTEKNFNTFLKYEKKINNPSKSIGFLRFEFKNNEKFLIDCGYNESKICFTSKQGIVEITDDLMFRGENCHQGCWFLKTSQIQNILNEIYIGNTLEDKVSNYYFSEIWPGTQNGIKKLIPFCDFENLLIHHQPNKYVNIYQDLPLVSKLLSERNENFICN
jgi:hypothetical protein